MLPQVATLIDMDSYGASDHVSKGIYAKKLKKRKFFSLPLGANSEKSNPRKD